MDEPKIYTAEESLKMAADDMQYGKIDIKRAVSEGRRAYFRHYTDGDLWYVTDFDEAFPVPVADLGTATLHINEKALLLMRYMRKWNEMIESEAHKKGYNPPDR